MIKVGQICCIRVTGGEGHITHLDKNADSITISWGSGKVVTYYLSHIENLVRHGTLKIRDDLPPKDPNLLFKKENKS